MKLSGAFLLAAFCVAGIFANVFPPEPQMRHLLGSKKCTWGPSYWCSNLTAAAGCKAVKHCIQTVWEKKTYPEDKDSVCQTCISMVKQARDQLESNETQEDIKEVFEGSCKLIPIKIVSKECCNLADQFIPELVETLASQMNPSVVCSVAGLCNNENIDKLLENQDTKTPDEDAKSTEEETGEPNSNTCSGCYKVVNIMEDKFSKMSRDDFLQELLHVCGRMGSFSDACSNIIITYFSNIYNRMKESFNSRNICLMSGECSTNFHVHDIEVTPLAKTGVINVNDDLPCDLCKQLVGHLRDLLIANTTEDEFQKVLQGLCKQTQGFKTECLSIVNEYYPVIYNFLVSELNSTQVCSMIGICPAPTNNLKVTPIIPLLPVESKPLADKLVEKSLKKVQIPNSGVSIKIVNNNKQFEQQPPEMMQLPIERLGSPMLNPVYNKELCAFCEYFLHYLQQALTDPKTEDSIKNTIDKACTKLPRSINQTCVEFVNTYSDALIAILAQEIDPSTVCPMMHACPGSKLGDVEVFMQGTPGDKPNCPLCLFAVTRLEEMVKEKKSRESIKSALNTLCDHLPANLLGECKDFVQTYTDELVEMLMDDFKPQEVCVYLKLCKDNVPAPDIRDFNAGGLIYTNEIPDFTANGKVITPMHKSLGNKPECPLCEFVMEKVENALKDKSNEEEIKEVIHGICNHLPHTLSTDCNDFVDKYADMVLQLLIASVKPSEICAVMNLCDKETNDFTSDAIEGPVKDVDNLKSPLCVTCKILIKQFEKYVVGSVTEEQFKQDMESTCYFLPGLESDCIYFVEKYGTYIYDALETGTEPGNLCSAMFLCGTKSIDSFKKYINKCAICDTAVVAIEDILKNPKVDHSIEHVLEKGCRALPMKHQKGCKQLIEEKGKMIFDLVSHMFDTASVCKEIGVCSNISVRAKREHLLGEKTCTQGPSYWCISLETASSCGDGPREHCEKNVWKGPAPSP